MADAGAMDSTAVAKSRCSCKRGGIGNALELRQESESVIGVGAVAQLRQYVNEMASLMSSNRDESRRLLLTLVMQCSFGAILVWSRRFLYELIDGICAMTFRLPSGTADKRVQGKM